MYEKNNFKSGDKLYAHQLNLIDDKIYELDSIIPCSRNLLDNWYFVNPVNQRGQTKYEGAQTYAIDRWKLQYVTNITLNSGYTLVEGSWDLVQALSTPLSPNRTYTISALISDLTSEMIRLSCGTVDGFDGGYYFTKDFNLSDIGNGKTLISYTFTPDKAVYKAGITLSNSAGNLSYKLYAMKLEFGSHQTLAHQENGQWVLNDIPDYGEQLRKCQQYYWTFKSTFNLTKYQSDGNKYIGVLQFPTEMHSNPSVTYTTGSGTVQQVNVNKQRIEFVGQASASNASCYVNNVTATVAGLGG